MIGGTITVEGLSKRYRLGARRQRFRTLREALSEAASPARWTRGRAGQGEELWALRDVSFTVAPGDIVGIIGPNGAGKSTLLKILTRITEPTEGWAEIRGRVGSLLEVGTGFHPELTGRENVYLNGAVLGMRRTEIQRRFDEIVDFAEVESFLDTPVKRYSSGMAVRLAFSVAAHLDPEVLLVDEVLAVGDAAFQRKCLGKMDDVARDGRTVLFVSHNMAVVQAFCRRGIVIRSGRLRLDGTASEAVSAYLRGLERAGQSDLADRADRRGWNQAIVRGIEITGADGLPEGTLMTGGPARFTFRVTEVQQQMSLSFAIVNVLGQPVARLSSAHPADQDVVTADSGDFHCEITALPLVPGRYRVDLALRGAGHLQDALEGAAFFDVEAGVFDGRGVAADDVDGSVFIPHRWSTPQERGSTGRPPRAAQ